MNRTYLPRLQLITLFGLASSLNPVEFLGHYLCRTESLIPTVSIDMLVRCPSMQSTKGHESDLSQHPAYLADDLSEILKVLYSAVLSPEKWQTFLSLLCEIADCRHAFMICADSQMGLSVRAQGDGDFGNPQLVDAYNQRYSISDPFRQPVVQNRLIGVFEDGELLPDEGLLRTNLYREQLAPIGLRYATLIVATVSVRRLEALSLWRTLEQGPISEESRQVFEFLFPHIQKALEIRHVLSASEQRAASAETMIDASATAAFLVKKDGRLIHRNAAAEMLLDQGDPLCLLDGVVTAVTSHSKEALRNLLIKVGKFKTEPPTDARQATTLERASGEMALNLLALPLSAADQKRTGAEIMMIVSDPTSPVAYPDHVLQSLYGLTTAQTEIANGLLAGYSLEEIAGLRNVSTGTVRQQLKAVMAKTGTKRQGELVSLLFRVPHSLSNKL